MLLLHAVNDGSNMAGRQRKCAIRATFLCQPCSGEPHTELGQIA